MTKLKSAKEVRKGQHIYGQLPNRLTPSEVRSLDSFIIHCSLCGGDGFGSVLREIKMNNEKLYLHEDWMPIATAPKDGNRVCLALWNNENYLCWITIGWWDKKAQSMVAQSRWKIDPPTHWMPLPQSPKGENNAHRRRFQKCRRGH